MACPKTVCRGGRASIAPKHRGNWANKDEPAPREFARNDDLALRVDCVDLKSVVHKIEAKPRDGGEILDRLRMDRLDATPNGPHELKQLYSESLKNVTLHVV
jgi:hypothetical protein